MNYKTGERIYLLDKVKTDAGQVGFVTGFDQVGERKFVIIRTDSMWLGQTKQIWVSDNAIEKL